MSTPLRLLLAAGAALLVLPAAPAPAQQAQKAPRAQGPAAVPVSGDQLLRETGVELRLPEGFAEIPPPPNELYAFEKAWRKADGSVEIRMAFRPLKRMVIDYTDPHSSAPSPEDMHEMVFTALLGQIATSGEMPMRNLSRAAARKAFNADWAAIATFGAEPSLNTRHKEGMLLGIHKFRQADVYVLILYDGPEKARDMLKKLVKVVRFREATPEEVLKAAEEADRKAREGYIAEGMAASGGAPQCEPPQGASEVHRTEKDLDQSPAR